VVDERVTDGRRIAQLLAAELRGHERGALGRLAVTDIRDVEGSEHGEFAYGVALLPPGETADRRNPDVETRGVVERLADVYVHTDRARVEFRIAPDTAADAGQDAAAEAESGLRVRPKATTPPRTLLFLESGVAAKRALPVFQAVVETSDRS
jgi:hypothetical protein